MIWRREDAESAHEAGPGAHEAGAHERLPGLGQALRERDEVDHRAADDDDPRTDVVAGACDRAGSAAPSTTPSTASSGTRPAGAAHSPDTPAPPTR